MLSITRCRATSPSAATVCNILQELALVLVKAALCVTTHTDAEVASVTSIRIESNHRGARTSQRHMIEVDSSACRTMVDMIGSLLIMCSHIRSARDLPSLVTMTTRDCHLSRTSLSSRRSQASGQASWVKTRKEADRRLAILHRSKTRNISASKLKREPTTSSCARCSKTEMINCRSR